MALNTISFLSFKQMFDTAVALDGRSIDFKIFQSSLGLFIFLPKMSSIELSFVFPNKILNLILNFFVIFFINGKLWIWNLKQFFANMDQLSYFSIKPFLRNILNSNPIAWNNFVDNFHLLEKKFIVCRIYTRKAFIIWETGLLQFFDKRIDAVLTGS